MNDIFPIFGLAAPMSSLMSLVGAVVFGRWAFILLPRLKNNLTKISFSIFALSCIFLLSLSAIYHSLTPGDTTHNVFQRLDHAAIFAFIAGTFTPIHAILFTGFLRWGMLAIVWGIATTGIIFKMILFDSISEGLGLSIYLLMGWLGLVSGIALWKRYGFSFVKPLVWGGIAYTIGALLEYLVQPILLPGLVGPHEIFHIAVLTGIGLHWTFVHKTCSLKMPAIVSTRDVERG